MSESQGYIVCGWYTPDYAKWVRGLADSLDKLRIEYDFVSVPKIAGGWERNTMRKPAQILAAMNRHPDKVIVFLDVDCEVLAPLDALASIKGDVGFHMRCKYRKSGLPRMAIRSGTIVVKPTPMAVRFIHAWVAAGKCAPRGSVDQRTLPMAIAATPGLAIEFLDGRYCAVAADHVATPAILHDSASRKMPKISSTMRSLYALLWRWRQLKTPMPPSASAHVPPAGYWVLPDGMRCRCQMEWMTADGRFWCCASDPVINMRPNRNASPMITSEKSL